MGEALFDLEQVLRSEKVCKFLSFSFKPLLSLQYKCFSFFSLSLIFVQSVMNLKLIVFVLFVMVRRLDFIFLRPRFD